jgi:hypothetical protein
MSSDSYIFGIFLLIIVTIIATFITVSNINLS